MSLSTFAVDLAAWLASRGVGAVGSTLFIGQLPPQPIDAVLLVETGGRQGDRARGVDFPTIQVTCRSASYASARANAQAVFDLLNEPATSLQMGTSRVTYCKALQPPTSLGVDEAGAWRIVCNFRFWLAR